MLLEEKKHTTYVTGKQFTINFIPPDLQKCFEKHEGKMPSQHISTAFALGRSSSLLEWLWMAFPICSQLLFFPVLVQACYRNQADLLAPDLQRLSQAGLLLGGESLAAIQPRWACEGCLTPITEAGNKLFEINTEIIFGGHERPGLSPPWDI